MASKLVIIVTNSRCCVYIPNSHLSWTWSSSASQMNLKEHFVFKLCKYQSFCTVKLKHLIEVSGRQIWSCLWPAFLSNSCPISGSGSFLETEVGHCASSNMSQAVENKRFPLAARLVQVRTFVIPYTAQTQVFWTKTGCGPSCFSPPVRVGWTFVTTLATAGVQRYSLLAVFTGWWCTWPVGFATFPTHFTLQGLRIARVTRYPTNSSRGFMKFEYAQRLHYTV